MNLLNSFERQNTNKKANLFFCADNAIEYVVFWRNLHCSGKNFTLPSAVTGETNINSGLTHLKPRPGAILGSQQDSCVALEMAI